MSEDGTTMTQRRYKIMAADDDPALLQMLADTLVTGGYDVATAEDGQQAVSVALEERPDLVILDVSMPELDGIQVVKRLRDDERTRDTIILLLTAVRAESAVEASFESGANDYLVKPFTVAHLLARVQTWLLRLEDQAPRDQ
jgi:DNA-binding response OmpR family regulator